MAAALIGGALLCRMVFSSGAAFGYCRTTTCAQLNPPADCTRDFRTGCWTAGMPLSWHASCVSFSVAAAGSGKLGIDDAAAKEIAATAFANWPNTSCDTGFPAISVAGTASVSCDRLEYNPTGPNSNAVLFRDTAWPHDNSIIALTTVTFNRKTGEILDADMEVNSPTITVADLPFVLTHEAGHFFGIDHSNDLTAVMYPQFSGYTPAGTLTVLSPDDKAAICVAYPPTQKLPTTCKFEPAKGFAPDCGGNLIAGCAMAGPASRGPKEPGWRRHRAVEIVGAMGLAVAVVLGRRRRR